MKVHHLIILYTFFDGDFVSLFYYFVHFYNNFVSIYDKFVHLFCSIFVFITLCFHILFKSIFVSLFDNRQRAYQKTSSINPTREPIEVMKNRYESIATCFSGKPMGHYLMTIRGSHLGAICNGGSSFSMSGIPALHCFSSFLISLYLCFLVLYDNSPVLFFS